MFPRETFVLLRIALFHVKREFFTLSFG